MTFIIDRIEGGYALCENEKTRAIIEVPLEKLPKGVMEGDRVLLTADGYRLNNDVLRKREMDQRLKGLFHREKGK